MLRKKANDGTISIDEMAGGTFTISNGGTYGSLISTPIINPPQVSETSLFALLCYHIQLASETKSCTSKQFLKLSMCLKM